MSTSRAASLRHVRPVQPLRFPEQEPDEGERLRIRDRLERDCAVERTLREVEA